MQTGQTARDRGSSLWVVAGSPEMPLRDQEGAIEMLSLIVGVEGWRAKDKGQPEGKTQCKDETLWSLRRESANGFEPREA